MNKLLALWSRIAIPYVGHKQKSFVGVFLLATTAHVIFNGNQPWLVTMLSGKQDGRARGGCLVYLGDTISDLWYKYFKFSYSQDSIWMTALIGHQDAIVSCTSRTPSTRHSDLLSLVDALNAAADLSSPKMASRNFNKLGTFSLLFLPQDTLPHFLQVYDGVGGYNLLSYLQGPA